jgi:hypothetical protein
LYKLIQRWIDYFSLWGAYPVLGASGSESRRQIVLYFGVALGAACKVVYDAYTNQSSLQWASVTVSLIASLVIFPQLYYAGGLGKRQMNFAHWALAFQNGFFWSVALGQLAKKLGAS